VGIGPNGHLGFNEPGTPWDTVCHVADLAQITIDNAVKYFPNLTKPIRQGITVGVKHIMESRRVMLLASGAKKTDIIRQTVQGEQSTAVPSTVLQSHPDCLIVTDEACWQERG
jgi:6-phosphogluconolactonase/glucosamine-6-phosphate isomerase/deaminase